MSICRGEYRRPVGRAQNREPGSSTSAARHATTNRSCAFERKPPLESQRLASPLRRPELRLDLDPAVAQEAGWKLAAREDEGVVVRPASRSISWMPRNVPSIAFGMRANTYRPNTPLTTTTAMLQKAIETIPPNLNVVCRRTRKGPSVHRKMWNWSQFPSPPAPPSHETRLRAEVERDAHQHHGRAGDPVAVPDETRGLEDLVIRREGTIPKGKAVVLRPELDREDGDRQPQCQEEGAEDPASTDPAAGSG